MGHPYPPPGFAGMIQPDWQNGECSMPSRIFQNVIIQMKDSIDRTVGVVDDQGYVIACSELASIGSRVEDFRIALVDAVSHELVTSVRKIGRAHV